VQNEFAGLRDAIAAFRRDLLGHFNTIYAWLQRLTQEYRAITADVRRLEEDQRAIGKRVASLAEAHQVLVERVAWLESGVAALNRCAEQIILQQVRQLEGFPDAMKRHRQRRRLLEHWIDDLRTDVSRLKTRLGALERQIPG
jgi:chromosome segregation ATPase